MRNYVILNYKGNAKKRGLEFNLSLEFMEKLFKSNCFYCGISPYKVMQKHHNNGPYIYNGIDRKDNDLGYIEDNCVACCERCNYLKSSYSLSQFLELIRTIVSNTTQIKI